MTIIIDTVKVENLMEMGFGVAMEIKILCKGKWSLPRVRITN